MRSTILAAAALSTVAAFAQPQQQPERPPKRPVEELTVRTKDGWVLPISYYPIDSKDAPVVVLLHGRDGDRGVWRGFADQLQSRGFAAVAVDLRKHGESEPPGGGGGNSNRIVPADYQGMARFDLDAVKQFLIERHNDEKLNVRKTAVVAADDSAPVAVAWAAADWLQPPYPDAPTLAARTPRGQDVRAVVLLSPTESIGGMPLGRSLPALRTPAFGVAAFVAVGELDQEDKNTASKTFERLNRGGEGDNRRVFLETYPQVKARGVELLAGTRGKASGQIISFLDKHLKQLPDEWRLRKSRLQ